MTISPVKSGEAPRNMKEVPASRFFIQLSNFDVQEVEHHSWEDEDFKNHSAVLFYFSFQDTGYGYIHKGGEPVSFFTFADCDHDYSIEQTGRCEYKHTCQRCGDTFTTDSSD